MKNNTFYEHRKGIGSNAVESDLFTFKGFGIWIFSDYISIFCDKDSPFIKKIPIDFWTQKLDIYQKGFNLERK